MRSEPPQTDEALMRAYVAGDREAYGLLFRRYSPILLALMRRGVSNPKEAEDLVQETFLQLHRARFDFRPDAKLRPWLMTIALNLKRADLRRRGRRKEGPLEPDGQLEPSVNPRLLETLAAQDAIHKALPRLPDGQREVIELHWLIGLSFPEIAEQIGASLSAVKVRAHRGYHALREIIGEET